MLRGTPQKKMFSPELWASSSGVETEQPNADCAVTATGRSCHVSANGDCLSFLLRYFPFGIVFLIAGKILEMDDPSAIGKKLGFYAITVVCGLVVHGLFILPMMYFFITKKNPIVFIRGILQALLIALATSSRYYRVSRQIQ